MAMSESAVLYLDADDEITSAAARIRATEAERIAVVLPYGSRLATSRINFRLLAREATERGKAIEIVAADASARALALTAGLTVHPSVSAFEAGGGPNEGGGPDAMEGGLVATAPTLPAPADADAPTSVILVPKSKASHVPVVGRVRPPVRSGVAIGLGLAVVAFIAIGGVLAYALLPSATIVLSPWSSTIGPLSADVVADPNVTAADPATLTVPARRFTFGVAVSQTFEATGAKVTESKATGSVTFRNCDPSSTVIIPAGSKVATASGVQFVTVARLSIRKATFQPPSTVNCRLGSVGIEALLAGTAGNVAADLIREVPPGYDSSLLFVTNPEPTSGGTHDETPQISQADVDGALATLTAALPGELDRQIGLATGVPTGTTLYPQTKALGTATPTVDPRTLVGKQLAEFELGLGAQGSVIGVDSSPIRSLAEARLRSQVQTDWSLEEASISIDVGAPNVVGQVVSFPVSMSARQVRNVNQAALLAAVQGLDVPAARARLDDFGNADIRLWPDWVTTIPTNASRVTLTLGDPAPLPSPTP
jgi:hypothetical protein